MRPTPSTKQSEPKNRDHSNPGKATTNKPIAVAGRTADNLKARSHDIEPENILVTQAIAPSRIKDTIGQSIRY